MTDKDMGAVLIVDDNPLVLNAVTALLEEDGYKCFVFGSANEAITASGTVPFDVMLTDIKMPSVSGLTLLEKMRHLHPDKPVILMTAFAELDTAVDAIRMGAFDFIVKPFVEEQLINTIKKAAEFARLKEMEINYKKSLEATVQQRTHDLKESLSQTENLSREIIRRLTRTAEYRDPDTRVHISRIGLYSNKLAEALNMPEDFVHAITYASPMHDIGKIGIPDSILLKQGKLTPEEFEIMKTHASIGHNILDGSSHPVIKMAASIALHHHERWDGTGYPQGLKGKDIPIEGMIAMIVDQYDALRSKRPYKPSFSHEEAVTIITEGDGRTVPTHFRPEVLNAFIELAREFNKIFTRCSDAEKNGDYSRTKCDNQRRITASD